MHKLLHIYIIGRPLPESPIVASGFTNCCIFPALEPHYQHLKLAPLDAQNCWILTAVEPHYQNFRHASLDAQGAAYLQYYNPITRIPGLRLCMHKLLHMYNTGTPLPKFQVCASGCTNCCIFTALEHHYKNLRFAPLDVQTAAYLQYWSSHYQNFRCSYDEGTRC